MRACGTILLFFCLMNAAVADETVRKVQERLKADGFYFGSADGEMTAETSAAISRYQIRNGLDITGRLDAETRRSLGLKAAPDPAPETTTRSETWRQLRKLDRRFLERLNDGEIPPPGHPSPVAKTKLARQPSPPPPTGEAEHLVLSPERLRDYVAAFVLAGIDPTVGAELEFFADRVRYYNRGVIPKEAIRRDLERYNQRWPQRTFRLAGELEVEPQPNSQIEVTFPLRYELGNGPRRASGRVRKTITLEVTGDDLEIVAVTERKM